MYKINKHTLFVIYAVLLAKHRAGKSELVSETECHT